MTNAGTYRLDKYGTRKKNKYIFVVITSDVRTKKIVKNGCLYSGRKH